MGEIIHNIKLIFYVGIIISIILLIGIGTISLVNNDVETSYEPKCTEICESNNQIFYEVNSGPYRNVICYCKNSNGGIQTYSM